MSLYGNVLRAEAAHANREQTRQMLEVLAHIQDAGVAGARDLVSYLVEDAELQPWRRFGLAREYATRIAASYGDDFGPLELIGLADSLNGPVEVKLLVHIDGQVDGDPAWVESGRLWAARALMAARAHVGVFDRLWTATDWTSGAEQVECLWQLVRLGAARLERQAAGQPVDAS